MLEYLTDRRWFCWKCRTVATVKMLKTRCSGAEMQKGRIRCITVLYIRCGVNQKWLESHGTQTRKFPDNAWRPLLNHAYRHAWVRYLEKTGRWPSGLWQRSWKPSRLIASKSSNLFLPAVLNMFQTQVLADKQLSCYSISERLMGFGDRKNL